MILAEGQIQWPATIEFIIGMVGLLTIVALIFTVAIQAKKLFGRTPPFHQELDKRDKALRKMIFAAESNLKDRLATIREETKDRIEALENRYEEMQLDRQRKWDELKNEYHALEVKFGTLTGQLGELLRELRK